MTSVESLGEALLDEALVAHMVPWPCPSDFGPDGRYRLEEIIGVGRTSLVYRAVDTHLSSPEFSAAVAIKIVGGEGLQRQEALNARRVKHDHVVRILDRGVSEDGAGYIVEELVDGCPLEAHAAPWPARPAAALMAKVARGMQAVHAAGVVHCDLKPGNVLIGEDGEPKISDFGLASTGAIDDATGGNLAFISPERYTDPVAGLAPPTDVYALAGMLFYLLTGRSPHGATIDEARRYLESDEKPPVLDADPILDAVCRRSLSRRPAERHQSAGEFADDLQCWLDREPIRWTRPSMGQELGLFVRRHRLGVGVSGVVVAALLMVVGGGMGLMAQSAADSRRAEQETIRKTDQQIEEIKARVRTGVRALAQVVPSAETSGLDLSAHHLGTLLWLDQFVAHPLLEDIRVTTVETERIRIVRELRRDLHAEGAPTLATLLADHTLAFLLLRQGDWEGALRVSEGAIDDWQGRLDEQEPVWISLTAIHEGAAVLRDRAEGADAAVLRARLDALDLADRHECAATHQLLEQMRSTLGEPAPDR